MNQSMEKYLAVKKRFEEQEDRENAVRMSKYLRDQFAFYGLPTPKRKALYKDFLREDMMKIKDRLDFPRPVLRRRAPGIPVSGGRLSEDYAGPAHL